VPSAEKKMAGVGVMDDTLEGQAAEEGSMMLCSFGAVAFGARRDRVYTLLMEGCESSVERMLEPCGRSHVSKSRGLIGWQGCTNTYN
jgi:hypothetical protein